MKIIFLNIFFFGIHLLGESLKVGDNFPQTSFKNQFEYKVSISKNIKKFIIVFSKDDSEKVKTFLEKNPTYLQTNKVLYAADLSEAPSLVVSMIMKPKFKKYPYSMILLEEKQQSELFPKNENKITILTLDNLQIKKIEYKTNLE
ncbi:MAG: hypothetical protein L0Y61_01715 [Epsilonproteobacteria bacterium]|nr:hypothetical protein [Campylobacterota bacterium]